MHDTSATTTHEGDYTQACQAWGNPGRDEAALLWLYTSRLLKPKVYHRIDFKRHEVNFEDIGAGLSSGERLLVKLGQVLYLGEGEFPIAELANTLSDPYWTIAMRALEIHRGR